MIAFPFPFAVSLFTTQSWSFEDDVRNYVKCGVEVIELCEEKVDPHRLAEQMARLAGSGLAVSAVQPLVRTFGPSTMQPGPEGFEARTARLERSIRAFAPHVRGAPFIVNTGAAEGGNVAGAIEKTVEGLRRVCTVADGEGVSIALEPLNPTAMNAETAIWTVRQALGIIEVVGSARLGLCLDLWNVWQEAALEEAILEAGSRILVLQASDWRTPRSGADRLVPGDGAIPLSRLLQAVHRAGYRGACAVEIFSDVPDSLFHFDIADIVHHSRTGLEQAWAGVPSKTLESISHGR